MMITARSSRHVTAQPGVKHTYSPRQGEAQPHRPRAQPLTEQKSGHRCVLMIRSWSDQLCVQSGWASTFALQTGPKSAEDTESNQPTTLLHPVVLRGAANKVRPQLRGVKERHREDPVPTAHNVHLDGREQVTSILPLRVASPSVARFGTQCPRWTHPRAVSPMSTTTNSHSQIDAPSTVTTSMEGSVNA